MAMEERTGGSGNASSLLGLFQFILGGIISPIVGLKGQYDATPYIFVIMITRVILITLQVIYFRNHRKPKIINLLFNMTRRLRQRIKRLHKIMQ